MERNIEGMWDDDESQVVTSTSISEVTICRLICVNYLQPTTVLTSALTNFGKRFVILKCALGMLLRGMSEISLPMFSSRTFMMLQLIFKSFIHLEFIFVYGVSW